MNGERFLIITSQHTDKIMAKNTGTTEKTISKTKEEIIKEAKRIEEATLFSSKGHFQAASIWRNFHFFLGVPAAVLSAIAGASALSQFDNSGFIAGVLAIIVAAITSLMTFLNPNEKANTHMEAGNNYDALQNKARIFWSVDCWREKSEDVLAEKLKYLSDQKDKLNLSSPQIPWIAYQLAKKGIEAGEADYKVDKE